LGGREQKMEIETLARNCQLMNSSSQRYVRERGGGGEREFIAFFSLQNIGGSDEVVVAWQDHKLEGTSQSLEKQYLRLTSVSRSSPPVCTC
jgi:hypothetical protein